MKVIHIPRRFVRKEWGGTETVILETCRRLLSAGHETSIFTSMALAETRSESIGGVPVRRFPFFYPYFGLSSEAIAQLDRKGGNLFSLSLMRALIREPGLDLIHLHAGKRLGGIGRHVALRRKIPYVISLHGGILDVPAAEAKSWTEPAEDAWEWGKVLGWWVGSRRVFDDAAAIICVGKAEQEKMAKAWPRHRVVWLPNGVDTDRFRQGDGAAFRRRFDVPSGVPLYLTCGRIDPQKNQRFTVEQMPAILAREPEARLVLIGPSTNPEYAAGLRKQARSLGVENRVIMTGGLPPDDPGLVDAYAAADLFVLPSIHEPFGIVILEAWAAGLPVLASNVGGIPSFVTDGEDALLFPANDADAFLKGARALRSDPALARRLAENGCRKAHELYDWRIITQRLIDLYGDIYEHPLSA